MSTASGEIEKNSLRKQPKTSAKRKVLVVLGGISAAVIVALGLGLGIGLGLHRSSNSSVAAPMSSTSHAAMTNGSTWQPAVGTLFNYQLSALPTTNDTWGIPVWFIDLWSTSTQVNTGLQQNGAKVVCYFSAGSSEDWRPDFKDFQESDLGANLTGWEGERWVQTNSANVRKIMSARMDQAVSKGCDGVDPDNMDAYDNDGGGLNLTSDDAADYAHWLASEASSRGMAVGLKNAAAIIPQVIDVMQWSVNEECVNKTECGLYTAFINASKPVFNIEYPKGGDVNDTNAISDDQRAQICDQQANNDTDFTTIMKNMNLDGWIELCNGTSAVLD